MFSHSTQFKTILSQIDQNPLPCLKIPSSQNPNDLLTARREYQFVLRKEILKQISHLLNTKSSFSLDVPRSEPRDHKKKDKLAYILGTQLDPRIPRDKKVLGFQILTKLLYFEEKFIQMAIPISATNTMGSLMHIWDDPCYQDFGNLSQELIPFENLLIVLELLHLQYKNFLELRKLKKSTVETEHDSTEDKNSHEILDELDQQNAGLKKKIQRRCLLRNFCYALLPDTRIMIDIPEIYTGLTSKSKDQDLLDFYEGEPGTRSKTVDYQKLWLQYFVAAPQTS